MEGIGIFVQRLIIQGLRQRKWRLRSWRARLLSGQLCNLLFLHFTTLDPRRLARALSVCLFVCVMVEAPYTK